MFKCCLLDWCDSREENLISSVRKSFVFHNYQQPCFPSWLFCWTSKYKDRFYCNLLAIQTGLTVLYYAKFLLVCSCKLNSAFYWFSALVNITGPVMNDVMRPFGSPENFCEIMEDSAHTKKRVPPLHDFIVEQKQPRQVWSGDQEEWLITLTLSIWGGGVGTLLMRTLAVLFWICPGTSPITSTLFQFGV